MFKASRIKIVVAIMSILVILWVGTLGFIYASSYFEMAKQNEQMLKAHAEMYAFSQQDDSIKPPTKPFPNGNKPQFDEQSPMFKLSVFYTVALSHDGEIIEIKNQSPTVHTDEELGNLAISVINGKKSIGTKENLAFYKTQKNGVILVVFKDNTVINEGAMTIFRYTLIFGGIALVPFFFLSVFLAKKIVDPLEENYKKQKQFISDAGHELKTPVSVVNANAELLYREIGENKWLANIQYENERMATLVTQLLDLAKAENTSPQMERIDFSRLVRGEMLPFESVAFEKWLMLHSDITDGIEVTGNSIQLKQIISILLDNAIKHSSAKGEVYISLKKEHDIARLSVVNRGDEIPPEQRKKIFERFYRVDTARNSQQNCYGLGLAIAKAIINSHKGKIDVLCYNGFVEFRVEIPAV